MVIEKQEDERTNVGSTSSDVPGSSEFFLESHDWKMVPSEEGWDLVPNQENDGTESDGNPELSEIEQRVVPLILAVVVGLLVLTLFYFLTSMP